MDFSDPIAARFPEGRATTARLPRADRAPPRRRAVPRVLAEGCIREIHAAVLAEFRWYAMSPGMRTRAVY